FKKGRELQHSLTLKEYGNYGDIFSEDLSSLAFQRPDETKQLLKVKMRNIINRMKYDFTRTFKDDIGDDNNYAETAIIKEDKNSVDAQSHRMLEYSTDFNKSGELICTYGMEEQILILRPQVHSMIVSKIYSPSANIGYVNFETKFGGMAVAIDYPGNGIFIDTTRYAM
ncbi:6021_t:CDS:2, partial [Funneliformis geosporum]